MTTTASSTDPAALPWTDVPAHRPAPLQTLVASAQRLTSKKLKGNSFKKSSGDWQEDAWEMFDLVGEQRFLATTLAGRLAQARFFVGQLSDDDTAGPEETTDPTAQAVLEAVGGSRVGFAQLIARLAVNLFVAGDGWLVGIPEYLLPDSEDDTPLREQPRLSAGDLELNDLHWRMLSVSEVNFKNGDELELSLGSTGAEKVEVTADDVYLIRVWRPHPRYAWEADSPTRSSLPVLRELVGLTMHISAQVDSRLAGAGLLLVPQSAQRALKSALGQDGEEGEGDDNEDVFTEALMEAMMTPINDRSSASAVVPLVVTVPDESAEHFRFMGFSSPLDAEARELRDEAIRRLALGQDAPPELLLGVGSMNHWGAWLVREDVVTTHIEPILALICDALTTQYLRPVLEEQGYSEEQIERFVVWYDVSHMISRPNRANDAQTLHDKGVLSDEALRHSNGFDESDAPGEGLDTPQTLALDLVRSNPGLITDPGLPAVIEQIRAALEGDGEPGGDVPDGATLPVPGEGDSSDDDEAREGELPDTADDEAPEPGTDDPGFNAAPVNLDGHRLEPSSPDHGGKQKIEARQVQRPEGALSRALREGDPFREAAVRR